MTVWNVVEKLKRIEDAVATVETGILHDPRYKEVKELLEEYRDQLYSLEIRE